MTQAESLSAGSADAALVRLTAHDRGVLTELVRRADTHEGPFGETVTSNPDGTPCPPRSRHAAIVDDVRRYLIDRQLLLTHFDWGAWADGHRTIQRRDRATLASCTAQQCLQYLTLLVRADRFTEGTLRSGFETGLMQALLHRLHQHTYPRAPH
ncbi:DUF6508 domain-containing protein [Nocardia spumae]|uniref:DUF6508 domain-containing protein n=1 Tax=Nocardia spumae TaxID=2887190 RepID=UPI001D149C0D|nr:DUF6508 domain-containing protein [Nocardia spumae]